MTVGVSVKERLKVWGKASRSGQTRQAPSPLPILSTSSENYEEASPSAAAAAAAATAVSPQRRQHQPQQQHRQPHQSIDHEQRDDVQSSSFSREHDYDTSSAVEDGHSEPATVTRTYAGRTSITLKKVDIESVERRMFVTTTSLSKPSYRQDNVSLRRVDPSDIKERQITPKGTPHRSPFYQQQHSLRKVEVDSCADESESQQFTEEDVQQPDGVSVLSAPTSQGRLHRVESGTLDSKSTTPGFDQHLQAYKSCVPKSLEVPNKAIAKLNKIDIVAVEQHQNVPLPQVPLYGKISLRKVDVEAVERSAEERCYSSTYNPRESIALRQTASDGRSQVDDDDDDTSISRLSRSSEVLLVAEQEIRKDSIARNATPPRSRSRSRPRSLGRSSPVPRHDMPVDRNVPKPPPVIWRPKIKNGRATPPLPPSSSMNNLSQLRRTTEEVSSPSGRVQPPQDEPVRCTVTPRRASPVPSYARLSLRPVYIAMDDESLSSDNHRPAPKTPIKPAAKLKKSDNDDAEIKSKTAHTQKAPPETTNTNSVPREHKPSEDDARKWRPQMGKSDTDKNRMPLYRRDSLRKVSAE